ncbi:MAG: site-specific DNA-methyltransferase, partial [Clostridiales Family XIII bacterium]|nr:site-specific DNA-methyltransferase [Clostridiales Family XIII bacterium]
MDTNKIFEDALRLWRATPPADIDAASRPGPGGPPAQGNLLLLGDNLALMAALAEQAGAGIRAPLGLVYMDPPYFTNRDHEARLKVRTESGVSVVKAQAFSDIWTAMDADGGRAGAMESYLAMLTPRLIAARELLAGDGALWLHLDRRAVHYAKVMADAVFGDADCLVNEVVWSYKSGGSSTKRFANKHDTLLFYAKNKRKYKFFPQEEKSYNRALKPYRFKGVKEYRDDHGWYTIVNMKDVWEIPMVGRTAAERTGYATQKPEALLERIVLACTEAGDACLDPFGGSGTLAAVCARHGRGWICIDENPMALKLAAAR